MQKDITEAEDHCKRLEKVSNYWVCWLLQSFNLFANLCLHPALSFASCVAGMINACEYVCFYQHTIVHSLLYMVGGDSILN